MKIRSAFLALLLFPGVFMAGDSLSKADIAQRFAAAANGGIMDYNCMEGCWRGSRIFLRFYTYHDGAEGIYQKINFGNFDITFYKLTSKPDQYRGYRIFTEQGKRVLLIVDKNGRFQVEPIVFTGTNYNVPAQYRNGSMSFTGMHLEKDYCR